MRTTRRQIEAMAGQVVALLTARGVDTDGWRVDYYPLAGGYCLATRGGSLGEAMMDANRMAAGDFYRALRMLRDVLERLDA